MRRSISRLGLIGWDVMGDVEQVRQKYLPEKVKVLIVGESPPHSGKFFYTGDDLTSRTWEAFSWVFMDVIDLSTYEEFLNFFKKQGFFLDDLCLEPINRIKANNERIKMRKKWVPSLAERMKEYNPEAIVFIMKGARQQFEDAVKRAGLCNVPRYYTSFPSFSEQNKKDYVQEMVSALIDIFGFDKFLKEEEETKKNKIPTSEDFREKLNEIFSNAHTSYVDISSRELHIAVGGYHGSNHRMPLCCQAMRSAMTEGDQIMYEPPSGQGATFHIRYKLPRP